MVDPSLHTAQLHGWLERMRAGDLAAREELFRHVLGRLERLARKMLRRFPNVQRWAETGDVLAAASLRLLRALEQVRPDSVRDFFGLAAEQIRRELLDMARHFNGPHGAGARYASLPLEMEAREPPAAADDPDELERWCAFHEEVERLPTEERELVGLIFYQGWTQGEVAEVLQVSERTVRRRWEAALLKLHQILRDDL